MDMRSIIDKTDKIQEAARSLVDEAGSLRKTQTMCVFAFLKLTLFLFAI